MRINRFEEVEVWRLARELAGKIYIVTDNGKLSRDYSFRDQIRRSAVSVMANIAEGFERQTNKELIQFLFIAKGSAGELRSHLYLAKDNSYLTEDDINHCLEQVIMISRSLSGLIKYLKD